MDFGQAVSSGFSNITNFSGRAGRSEFWWFVLAVWVAEIVVSLVIGTILRGNLISFAIYVLFALAILSVGFRRLQDVGQNGWLVLLALIPCVGLILIYFWVQPSQPGSNQYGEPPTA